MEFRKLGVIYACSLCLVAAMCISLSAAPKTLEDKRKQVRASHEIYPEPDLPKLPAAGGTFVDPTFGTTIMRVTDEQDGPNNKTAYSNWPVFNADSTYFHINRKGHGATLYRFDPKKFKILARRPLFEKKLPGGGEPVWEGAIWSAKYPEVIYGHSGASLWAYHVVKKEYQLLRNFADDMVAGGSLTQMTISGDDNIFVLTKRKRGFVGFIIWRRKDNKILYDEKKIPGHVKRGLADKSGKYVVLLTQQQGEGVVEQKVLHLASGKTVDILDDVHSSPGHPDVGHGSIVGNCNWTNRVTFRKLKDPHKVGTLLKFKDWAQGSHYSFLADDEDWVLVSFNKGAKKKYKHNVFHREIILLATDGSKRVRRLAHSRSIVKGYWDTPRATISKDGKFVAFTSNWGGSNRLDVFIIRVPKAPRQRR